jgi:ureidoglycolate dehydrogenase (NAD+)
MATSVAAGGKLRLAVDRNVPLPPGWALDEDGNPTTDARRAAILVPFGGYKGSGLAMMFETLTSLMAANPLLEPALHGEPNAARHRQNSVVAAIDVATFTDVDGYRDHVDRLIDGVKALPPAEGVSEVLVPGEPEDRSAEARGRDGVPLPEGTVRNLRGVAGRFGIPLPEGLRGGR